MIPRSAISATVAAVLALALTACGEKEEPSATELRAEEPATTVEQPTADPASYEGKWTGQLRQQGLKPFKVEVDIRGFEDEKSPVSYTSIDCSGTWTPEATSDGTFIFREVIDRGKGGDCKGIGTVTLTPVGERLLYEFTGGGVESRGRLHRVP